VALSLQWAWARPVCVLTSADWAATLGTCGASFGISLFLALYWWPVHRRASQRRFLRGRDRGRDGRGDLGPVSRPDDAERRLEEFRDSDEALALKLRQLQRINGSRKRFGVPAVDLTSWRTRCQPAGQRGRAEWFQRALESARREALHRYAFAGGSITCRECLRSLTTGSSHCPTSWRGLHDGGPRSLMSEQAPTTAIRRTALHLSTPCRYWFLPGKERLRLL